MVVKEIGRMPLQVDLVRYAATVLQGEHVVASNDDIYPEGPSWWQPPEG